jgi:predicted transcriptional regulator
MKKVTNWENVSFINSSSYRKRVLEKLDKPKTPSSLSKELNLNKTHISRTLSELMEKKLITCLTPGSRKSKIYLVSENGKEVLEKQKNLSN